jgi:hypothetical protein
MAFDIDALLNFKPASGRCAKCLALLPSVPDTAAHHRCGVCGLTYIRTTIGNTAVVSTISTVYQGPIFGPPPGWAPPPSPISLPISFGPDAMDHAKELATLARILKSPGGESPLRVLVACLLRAKSFVHFTTWGISQSILGVLAAVSEFVPVAGIASGVDGNTAKEIGKLQEDFPRLDIRAVSKQGNQDADLIHTKLIVIDGLLALAGSPNLTADAWRKTAAKKERLDVVTDVERVIDDNNNFFSRHWAELRTEFDPAQSPWSGWTFYAQSEAEREADAGA